MQAFSSPAFVLSLVLASLYGALFHLIWGKSWSDFFLYWVSAILGFGLGQAIGNVIALKVLLVGEVHLLEASLVCWAALFIARWLKL
jgi:hypothetical protein